MKNILLVCFLAFSSMLVVQSCSDCRKVECRNGGSCIDGECECLYGYFGPECEEKDFCLILNVNCRNEGICDNGICLCLTGFEGEECEIVARDKFLANFSATEECTSDTVPGIKAVTVHPSEITQVFIADLWHQQFFNDVVGVASGQSLTIPKQTPDQNEIQISGSGTLAEGDSVLTINYAIRNKNSGALLDQCTAILSKF